METVTIVIPGRPVTKKNSMQLVHAGKRIIPVPSKRYLEYEANARRYIKGSMGIDTPVNVKCLYYMPDNRLVDLANLLEATCDLLTHYRILVDDNSKIIVSHDGSRVLHDRENPRVEITIEDAEKGW